jgi:hypothetical protein
VSRVHRALWQRWLRVEDQLCALIGRAEHKLMRYPPGTRIVPSAFDRRMVRLLALVCSAVVLAMAVPRGPFRRSILLALLGGVVVAVFALLIIDARTPPPPGAVPPPMPPPRARTPRTPPPPPPPASRPPRR